jgi:hypothetical protein
MNVLCAIAKFLKVWSHEIGLCCIWMYCVIAKLLSYGVKKLYSIARMYSVKAKL